MGGNRSGCHLGEYSTHIIADFCTRWVVNAAGQRAKADLRPVKLRPATVSMAPAATTSSRTKRRVAAHAGVPGAQQKYMGIHITPTVDGNVTAGLGRVRTPMCWTTTVNRRPTWTASAGGAKVVAPHL